MGPAQTHSMMATSVIDSIPVENILTLDLDRIGLFYSGLKPCWTVGVVCCDAVHIVTSLHMDLASKQLSPDKWTQLEDAITKLEPFLKATLQIEWGNSCRHHMIIGMVFVDRLYSATTELNPESTLIEIAHAAHVGAVTLHKHSRMYQRILIYLAAVAQHPGFKWPYFQSTVEIGDPSDVDIELAKTPVQQMWLE
jgi:hypothetical protein